MKYANITKGRGDKGETDLLFGEKVSKDSSIIRLLGSIDEFNASIGLCIAHQKHLKERLVQIQNQLINLMGYIAALPSKQEKACKYRDGKFEDIEEYIEVLDAILASTAEVLDNRVGGQNGWANYGTKGVTSAFLDMTTTVCRRCELELLAFLNESVYIGSVELLVKYFNRLSKVLYLYARLEEE